MGDQAVLQSQSILTVVLLAHPSPRVKVSCVVNNYVKGHLRLSYWLDLTKHDRNDPHMTLFNNQSNGLGWLHI